MTITRAAAVLLCSLLAACSGSAGSPGPKGDTGPTGPKGDTGLVGPKGDTGAQGLKGDTGSAGQTGARGPAGTSLVVADKAGKVVGYLAGASGTSLTIYSTASAALWQVDPTTGLWAGTGLTLNYEDSACTKTILSDNAGGPMFGLGTFARDALRGGPGLKPYVASGSTVTPATYYVFSDTGCMLITPQAPVTFIRVQVLPTTSAPPYLPPLNIGLQTGP